jgi:hypothetical protein
MKTTTFTMWCARIVLVIASAVAFESLAFAAEKQMMNDGVCSSDPVTFDGEWKKRGRSFVQPYFILTDQMMYLYGILPQRVVTVSILNDAEETVYETETSGTDTLLLILTNLSAGEYRLELRDALDSYLYADFTIE